MKRFFAVILALGGLFFLTALAAPGELSSGKLAAVVIGAVLLLLSFALWGRLAQPGAAAAVAVPSEPRLVAPAVNSSRADASAERRALLKAKAAFEDLKHLHGIPGLGAKQPATLILAADGIRLVNPKDWDVRYHTIPWAAFRGVATSDAESASGDGVLNSVRSGAIARGSTLGSAVALETVGLLLDKSPLIVSFLLVPNDPMTSVAVFSTWQNEGIARRILSYRTELVASGSLRFDAPAMPASIPSDGEPS